MKRYIPISRIEGTASRQAHCDFPEGTYEREMGREGFFGPVTQLHHKHPPTGWVDWEGPLRPHAFNFNRIASERDCPLQAPLTPGGVGGAYAPLNATPLQPVTSPRPALRRSGQCRDRRRRSRAPASTTAR